MSKLSRKSPYTPQSLPSTALQKRPVRSSASSPYDASGLSKSAPSKNTASPKRTS
jgi:hypothetical protein